MVDAVEGQILVSARYSNESGGTRTSHPSPLARAIWTLGSDLVITTNYDDVLQWANDGGAASRIVVERGSALTDAIAGRLTRRCVWHLHGHISDPAALVLTPDGYQELCGERGVEERYRAARNSLRTMLAGWTFLFVGFSYEDQYIEAELNWLNSAFGESARQHYILVRQSELGPPPFHEYVCVLEPELPGVYRPVAFNAQPPDAGVIQEFEEKLVQPARTRAPTIRGTLVHTSAHIPGAEIERADRAGVHLIPVAEFEALIDFAPYLEHQQRQLEHNEAYAPACSSSRSSPTPTGRQSGHQTTRSAS
jgi:hypothetical protein